MGFGYHMGALSKDIDTPEYCINGLANIAVLKERFDQRRRAAVDARLEDAANKLEGYFQQIADALGSDGADAARRATYGADFPNASDAALLKRAHGVKTVISKAEAKKLAKFIQEATRDWKDY